MYDFLLMPWAIPVISGCSVAVVAIIFGSIKATLTSLAEAKLKQSMVDQGFSAAEIERVVRASSEQAATPGSSSCGNSFSSGHRPSKQPV